MGIDFSSAFIESAKKILNEKHSDLSTKVKFSQGDACNLSADLGHFDAIFAGNLIDRLYNPGEFLNHITKFMKPKSILVMTSPYSWL